MQDLTLSAHLNGLFGYAIVLSRNQADAADLVQETCIRALEGQRRLRPNSNIKAWLYTILRHVWLSQVRRMQSRPDLVDVHAVEIAEHLASDKSLDPHTIYEMKARSRRIHFALQQLPPEFREVILLREFEDLSYGEIAEILECPLGTVMSRLARGRAKLRTLLASEFAPSPENNTGEERSGQQQKSAQSLRTEAIAAVSRGIGRKRRQGYFDHARLLRLTPAEHAHRLL